MKIRAATRASLRLLHVFAHLFSGLLTIALIYPFCAEPTQLSLKQRWSSTLLRILGLKLKLSGELPPRGLLVSNHISFTDVFAINAFGPSSFVAKADVQRWPLIGWLAKHNDTLFLARGSRRAAQQAREQMAEHLRAGKRIVVFPEGATGNGDHVAPFHGALFQAAIDAAEIITPLAVQYTDHSGTRSYAAAFIGGMTLVECFWNIACADNVTVSVTILPVVHAHTGDRRHLSAHAHHAISHYLNPHH